MLSQRTHPQEFLSGESVSSSSSMVKGFRTVISFRQERVINYSEEPVLGSETGPLCDVELINIVEIILSRRPKSEQTPSVLT